MLDYPRLSAFYLGDAVFVVAGAGVDVHRLVDGRFKVGGGRLFCQIGAGDFDLQARLVGSGRHDIKVFRVHCHWSGARRQPRNLSRLILSSSNYPGCFLSFSIRNPKLLRLGLVSAAYLKPTASPIQGNTGLISATVVECSERVGHRFLPFSTSLTTSLIPAPIEHCVQGHIPGLNLHRGRCPSAFGNCL